MKSIARDRRRFVFLYIGDYDPSGMCMSEKDLPNRLRADGKEFFGGIDFEFRRVALTKAGTRSLGRRLSYDVTKKRDPRLAWFVKNYGTRGWEVDAMNPNDLRDRVTEEIKRYIDWDSWDRCERVGEAERQAVDWIAERMAVEADKIDARTDRS